MLEWQWPWLIVLLPIPWLLRRLLPAYTRQRTAIRVPFFIDLASSAEARFNPAIVPIGLASLMWLFLVAAVARPVWYGDPVNIATSGRDLLLAIDISDSMRIDDMQQGGSASTRIDVVKALASDFINARHGDRVGLILFGQQAYLQTPLTFDRGAAIAELKSALPGFAGSSTAIGDAMGLAINILRDRPAQSRVLILLSDGSNTYGSDPLSAMGVAREANIKIHAIGLGADTYMRSDNTGRKVEVNSSRDLDEQVLSSIAELTGGQYFRARNPDELSGIYAKIDELEPAPADEYLRPQKSLYHWPLALSLLFGLFLIALEGRQ